MKIVASKLTGFVVEEQLIEHNTSVIYGKPYDELSQRIETHIITRIDWSAVRR